MHREGEKNERKIRLGALKLSFSRFTTSPKLNEVKVSLLLDGNWLNLANIFFSLMFLGISKVGIT